MNFDLSWFTTISGMFITGGVILLIIALIILLITGRNSKKEKKKKEMELANAENNANVNTNTDAFGVQPMVETVPVVDNTAMSNNGVPTTQDIASNMMTNPVTLENTVPQVPSMGPNPVPTVPVGDVSGGPVTPTFDSMPTPAMGPADPSVMVSEPVPIVQPEQPANVAPEVVNPVPTVGFNGGGQSNLVNNGFTMPEEPIPVVQAAPPAPIESIPVATETPVSDIPSVSIPVISEEKPATVEPLVPDTMNVNAAPVVAPPSMVDVPNPVPVVDNPIPQVVIPSVSENVPQPVDAVPQPVDAVPQPVDAVPQPVDAVPSGPVIYGGASPIVTDFNVKQENHQIYGGADPLQNTQSIPTNGPTMTPVSNEPVMISQQPVSVVPSVAGTPESANPGVPPIAPIQ